MNSIIKWRSHFPNSRFPSIVDTRTMDDIWDNFFDTSGSIEKAMDSLLGKRNQVVPYDVIHQKDDEGNLKAYKINYAMSGYEPHEIDIEINDETNYITVKAEKNEETQEVGSNEEIVRKGIAQRSIQFSYHLDGIDKENISSSYKNGVLSLTLPTKMENKKISHIRKISLLTD